MACQTPKRKWGKTRQKEQILVLDQAHTQELISTAMKEQSQIQHRTTDAEKASKAGSINSIDLQHPELMSNSALVETLAQRRVPIPVYQDGKPSRERLLHLFRQHVTPRPQRSRQQAGLGRRRGGGRQARKREREELEFMEVDHWSAKEESSPVQRKRKLLDADITSPPKRPHPIQVEIPCKTFSEISVADNSLTSPPSSKTSAVRVIKLRRLTKPAAGELSPSSEDIMEDSGRKRQHYLPAIRTSSVITASNVSLVHRTSISASATGDSSPGHGVTQSDRHSKITWP